MLRASLRELSRMRMDDRKFRRVGASRINGGMAS